MYTRATSSDAEEITISVFVEKGDKQKAKKQIWCWYEKQISPLEMEGGGGWWSKMRRNIDANCFSSYFLCFLFFRGVVFPSIFYFSLSLRQNLPLLFVSISIGDKRTAKLFFFFLFVLASRWKRKWKISRSICLTLFFISLFGVSDDARRAIREGKTVFILLPPRRWPFRDGIWPIATTEISSIGCQKKSFFFKSSFRRIFWRPFRSERKKSFEFHDFVKLMPNSHE